MIARLTFVFVFVVVCCYGCCCCDCVDVWRCVYIICVRSREWEHAVTRNAKANKANQRESKSKNTVKATTAALEMESTSWQNQNILPRQ